MTDAIDKRLSTDWGLAYISGASLIGSAQFYMLANRITGRAHELDFFGGGLTLGVGKPGKRDKREFLVYKSFTTTRPVNFDDFHNRGAILTNIKTPLYSRSYLSIKDAANPLGAKLARIRSSGWSLPTKLSLTGHAWVNGILRVTMGSGDLRGRIKWVLDPEKFVEDFGPPGPRIPYFKSSPSEPPLIRMPDEVLFSFASASLSQRAKPVLMDVMHTIEARRRGKVTIEGHTDAKGSDQFNEGLSLKRAEAVRRWLVDHGCEGAKAFDAVGRGEKVPVAANTHSDGSDNPAWRAKNRRVEVHFG